MGEERNSNIELFRILSMLMIVAHHYVVNSGLLDCIDAQNTLQLRDYFLLLFGLGGKTGMNCFVLITGYFMCTSHNRRWLAMRLPWWNIATVVLATRMSTRSPIRLQGTEYLFLPSVTR